MASTIGSNSSSYATQTQIVDTNDASQLVPLPPPERQAPMSYDTSRDNRGNRGGLHDAHGKAFDTHVPQAPHGPGTGNDRPATANARAAHFALAKDALQTAAASKTSPAPSSTSLQQIADRYDGGPGIQRNYTADQQNGARLRDMFESSLAGYPPDYRKNYGDLIGLAPDLAELDGDAQQKYAARAKQVLQTPLAQQRPAIDALKLDVSQDRQKAMQDPARRLAGIFHAPVGSELLPDGGKAEQAQLGERYKRVVNPDTSPAERDKALQDASQIKAKMQADIAGRLDSKLQEQEKLHTASMQRINNFMDKAENLNGHEFALRRNSEDADWNDEARSLSAKAHPLEALAEQLVSEDGRSQQERETTPGAIQPTMRTPEEIQRDLLNFQDGMNTPDSDIYKRVQAMEKQATDTLTHNDRPNFYNVGAPSTFTSITSNLPDPGGNYTQNLANKYVDLAQDNHDKILDMVGQKPGLGEQIIYGARRVVAGQMPPGLSDFMNALNDAEYPDHAGLTQDQIKDIDLGDALSGLLPGGRERGPHLEEGIPAERGATLREGKPPAVNPTGAPMITGASGTLPLDKGLSGPSSEFAPDPLRKALDRTAPAAETQLGPDAHRAGPTGNLAPNAGVSTNGRGFDVPAAYSREPIGSLLPDPHACGVYRDEKGMPYVMANRLPFPVTFDKDNQTWRVARPDNPAGYKYPIHLEQGNWQVHGDVGLPAGNKPDPDTSGNNLANRDRLESVLEQSPTYDQPGSYPSSVSVVNRMLKHYGINLSDRSTETIIANVRRVDAGDLSHAGASAAEVWTFRNDLMNDKLPLKDRVAAALGVCLNAIGGPTYLADFDLQNYHFGKNQSADLRNAMHMYQQFDPKG
ncbi:hypothetical protein C9419_01700 [Paraburkholderia fungorum]|uniref:hypothetical protein n=2 Tax=Paraburkholderia fungorum TaxID=134537 RepID=UPI000DB89C6F|nr:hypothetical protein [Paraburkholderia fungorum]PZR46315.1 MAG: hypothetical protein DI523_18030 [Paraburkholderia fungorum]QLD47864.1 hypothetical protein C9419_01700 [Paraburkholderia fungorum]